MKVCVTEGAVGCSESLLFTQQLKSRLSESNLGDFHRCFVRREEECDFLFDWNVDRISRHRRAPRSFDRSRWCKLDWFSLHRFRSARKSSGLLSRLLYSRWSHCCRCRETPRAADESSDSYTI
jgi:hypothetical protein